MNRSKLISGIRAKYEASSAKGAGLLRVVLNVVDACNRSCSFCPRSNPEHYPNKPKHRMLVEHALRLSGSLAQMHFEGTYSLTGHGEPLLHPQLPWLIAALKQHTPKARVELQTNGDALTSVLVQRLIVSGLDKLILNVYDAKPQQDKIKLVESLLIETEVQYKNDPEGGFLETFNNRAGAIPIGDMRPKRKPCYMPFYKVFVDWDLIVYHCDYDWGKRIIVGHVDEGTNFLDIWYSERLEEIRAQLKEGKRSNEACRKCNVDGTLWGKEHALIYFR